jgi:hypothetical protein
MNILKNDSFTKTVFTDILPSDRLPNEIRKRPRGYIYLARILPINLDRIEWQCTLQKMTEGNFGILMVRLLDFTDRTLLNFWASIAVHLRGQYTLFFA